MLFTIRNEYISSSTLQRIGKFVLRFTFPQKHCATLGKKSFFALRQMSPVLSNLTPYLSFAFPWRGISAYPSRPHKSRFSQPTSIAELYLGTFKNSCRFTPWASFYLDFHFYMNKLHISSPGLPPSLKASICWVLSISSKLVYLFLSEYTSFLKAFMTSVVLLSTPTLLFVYNIPKPFHLRAASPNNAHKPPWSA